MTKKKGTVMFREFGALLHELQAVIPVGGEYLSDRKLCKLASIGTHTYGQVKKWG